MFLISAFGDEIHYDLEKQIDVLKRENIKYLEFRGAFGKGILDFSIEEIVEIKKTLDKNNIKVSALATPTGKIGINESIIPHIENFKKCLKVAEILQTRLIRIFSFYIPQGDDAIKYKDDVMERIEKIVNVSSNYDVILCHENEKEIFGDIAERCLEILKTFPTIRAVFDPANFIQVGQKPYKDCFVLLKPYIVYFHIKDALFSSNQVKPAGEGDGQIAEILREVRDLKPNIFLSLEPHLSSAGKFSGFSGEQLFNVAATSLREILYSIGAEFN